MLSKKKNEPKFEFENTDSLCQAQGCRGANFRGLGVCRFHHLERIEKLQAQRAADEEKIQRLVHRKDWPETFARGQYQSANRVCAACGRGGLLTVRQKPKDRRPTAPCLYRETLEVLCASCLSAGK